MILTLECLACAMDWVVSSSRGTLLYYSFSWALLTFESLLVGVLYLSSVNYSQGNGSDGSERERDREGDMYVVIIGFKRTGPCPGLG